MIANASLKSHSEVAAFLVDLTIASNGSSLIEVGPFVCFFSLWPALWRRFELGVDMLWDCHWSGSDAVGEHL